MAKSLRSKVKREYRSKKREDGIYAATEAARLHRLNAKLRLTISPKLDQDDMDVEEGMPGWFWFTAFGLLDSDDISPESMRIMNRVA
jgi:hypothetical protein